MVTSGMVAVRAIWSAKRSQASSRRIMTPTHSAHGKVGGHLDSLPDARPGALHVGVSLEWTPVGRAAAQRRAPAVDPAAHGGERHVEVGRSRRSSGPRCRGTTATRCSGVNSASAGDVVVESEDRRSPPRGWATGAGRVPGPRHRVEPQPLTPAGLVEEEVGGDAVQPALDGAGLEGVDRLEARTKTSWVRSSASWRLPVRRRGDAVDHRGVVVDQLLPSGRTPTRVVRLGAGRLQLEHPR